MSPLPTHPTEGRALVPRWLVYPASALLLFHLGAVLANALAAPSGPWLTTRGSEMPPPQLLARLSERR